MRVAVTKGWALAWQGQALRIGRCGWRCGVMLAEIMARNYLEIGALIRLAAAAMLVWRSFWRVARPGRVRLVVSAARVKWSWRHADQNSCPCRILRGPECPNRLQSSR